MSAGIVIVNPESCDTDADANFIVPEMMGAELATDQNADGKLDAWFWF